MSQQRFLVIVADDFGIGPATSLGILDLAARRVVTGSVLLVNSPYAEQAVTAWRQAGSPMELGWHPSLTLDCPILPAAQVPSLVNAEGRFWPLGRFIKRLFVGRIAPVEIEAELRAQYGRCCDLLGHPPTLVNVHQHANLFHPVGAILLNLLGQKRPLPYLRRIQEPWKMFWHIPGARKKRLFLSFLGRSLGRVQKALGFPGSDWLMGTTDPPWVRDPKFFTRWLGRIPGNLVELACHPGHADATLLGRDCQAGDGLLQRRVDEYQRLSQPDFLKTCADVGLVPVSPTQLSDWQTGKVYAA